MRIVGGVTPQNESLLDKRIYLMVLLSYGWPVVIFNRALNIDLVQRIIMRERMEWIMDEGLGFKCMVLRPFRSIKPSTRRSSIC